MFLIITGGIFTLSHIDLIVCSFFGILTGDISFSLLRYNAIDESFFRFEVITHGLRLVRCFSVFKYRSTLLYTSSICHTTGIHRTTVHIHCNQLGSQFNVLVIHLSITIQMSETSFSKHDRIGCFVNNRSIQRFFFRSCIKSQ